MKRILLIIAVLLGAAAVSNREAAAKGPQIPTAEEWSWKGQWISIEHCQSLPNTWLGFRKEFTLDKVPQKLEARIAVDSKYWLWVNGTPVVFEGGLKRGPAIGDSYYDKVDIAPYLKEGENLIAVLAWHFGKSGFSHLNSGTAALLFNAVGDGIEIVTDRSWRVSLMRAYQTAEGPVPNYRLPESNIRFDARLFPKDWNKAHGKISGFVSPILMGFGPGEAPLGRLVERPIPFWKDYGIREYESVKQSSDTIYCTLPYNCQVTPRLKVEAPAGKVIKMETDHRIVTGEECIRAEYVTTDGVQEYESIGWMNGEVVKYIVPEGVKVLSLSCRETGYNTGFTGRFACDDDFLNEYWTRARRTMYVCMRDTYYDCPDRERAQWWGDEVNELNEAFFLFSRSSDLLARKGILELAAWQKPDGSLYAPIPCSNYYKELPHQILTSVGWFGFHNYYFYSGDDTFIPEVYDAVHKYLHETWQLDGKGLPIYRKADWDWPDAGKHQDGVAQLHILYYLALKSEADFARKLGRTAEAVEDEALMANIAKALNEEYWNGSEYITPGHQDVPDDRVQALAVVAGLASPEKYPAILKVLSEQYHATTYMQRYVLEALCIMGRPDLAQERMHKLYPTVMAPGGSTLYEHWNFTGTNNHAWTGGAVTVMGERFAGIMPTEPGYRRFKVEPQMGALKHIETAIDTNYGLIELTLDRKGKRINLTLIVPEGTEAEIPAAVGKAKTFGPGTHKIRLARN